MKNFFLILLTEKREDFVDSLGKVSEFPGTYPLFALLLYATPFIIMSMLSKRLIICLDVRDKKVTKGVKFKGNVDIGFPET